MRHQIAAVGVDVVRRRGQYLLARGQPRLRREAPHRADSPGLPRRLVDDKVVAVPPMRDAMPQTPVAGSGGLLLG